MSSRSELSKLRWRCRRGMRELDVMLNHYLDHHYNAASEEDKQALNQLIDMADPELYDLMLGRAPCHDPAVQSLLVSGFSEFIDRLKNPIRPNKN